MTRRCLLAALVALLAGCGTTATSTTKHHKSTPTGVLNGLRVQGNRLVDDRGNDVALRGVFFVSFEWACSHQGGISSQSLGQAKINEFLAWHINFVRIGVPEDCWLGINGEPYGTTASAYRSALKSFVNLLHQNGIYTMIGLMFEAPGSNPSIAQAEMPDQDHSPAFWTSFAAYFKSEPDTIFGLSGENKPGKSMQGDSLAQIWNCWLHGGSACHVVYPMQGGAPYVAAGMQELVNAIRATGAKQPIAILGVRGNDLSDWLKYEPSDPDHALVADWHVYGQNPCFSEQGTAMTNNSTCWNGAPAAVAAKVPLINGELGEDGNSDPNACAWSWEPRYLAWADQHHVGYAAWKWGVDHAFGPCSNMALITDSAGDPSPVYGAGYKAWLAAHSASQ